MTQYVLYKEDANKYIGYSDTRKVIHVGKLENAYKFNTPNEARNARKKASKKMAYFHVYMLMDNGELEKVSANTPKRRSFTKEERIKIYRKTKGHCYLCGDFVDFDSYEIEHKVPISKGGTNDLIVISIGRNSLLVLITSISLLEKIRNTIYNGGVKNYGRCLYVSNGSY